MNTQAQAPKIEFPCLNYPVKVVGQACQDYVETMHAIMQKHAPECSVSNVKVNDSRNGSFRSVTFYITATGVEQLQNIHRDLSAHEYVRMVM